MVAIASLSAFLVLTQPPVDTIRPAPGRLAGTDCHAVTAFVTAEAARMTPALRGVRIRGGGTSRGDLQGIVTIDVVKPFVGNQLDVVLRIALAEGDLVTRGTATATRDAPAAGTHTIRTMSEVQPGRGAFARSRGGVAGIGWVNTQTRVIEIKLTGVVCADWSTAAGVA